MSYWVLNLVNEKAFGTREYSSGVVANRLKKEELAKQIGGEIGEDGTVSMGKLQKRIDAHEYQQIPCNQIQMLTPMYPKRQCHYQYEHFLSVRR